MSAARARKSPADGPKSDLGSGRIPKEIDTIAGATAFATVKRARRVDPLLGLSLPQGHYHAALIFRQAVEHIEAGIGMGPLPYARDFVAGSSDQSMRLWSQQRALSAADWHRRGVQAMGHIATSGIGVVTAIVLAEWSLTRYDRFRAWTEGRGATELRAALTNLSREYGTA